MTSFVQGRHRYLLPYDAELGDWARGRRGRDWPGNAIEIAPADLADEDIDVVVLQRPHELDLVSEWLRRSPGSDLPAIYVEHDTPPEHAALTRHVLADRTDIQLVHVTHFNRLMWDNGRCPTTVIPHGVLDPGHLYTGELPRAATIINEPVRRWRITGTDLLDPLSDAAPIDVYGMGTEGLHRALRVDPQRVCGVGDFTQDRLHVELARRRVFVHVPRWTSLGMSVIEAMYLGMPIVALGTTEASASIPAEAGVVSTEPGILAEAIRQFLHEPMFAQLTGKAARHWAQANFGIDEFVARWDRLLTYIADGQGG
ncbi:glycosyltransferase [Nocardia sp. NBC_00881]|uniref:glycosyltransferase n=1 Tax=Nocardia sp. NBC_00881 TaxID=2975995 RepID=UPI00386F5600|nr:glycosyltransferase [Nocardia sp. NBC_00881]